LAQVACLKNIDAHVRREPIVIRPS